MKIHKSAFALVLSLVAFLAGCQIPFAVNGEQQSVNPFEAIGGLFTRETTKERTEYIAANPGDALAELLRADDQMILGSKHSGVYFYATLDTLAKRQKAVEAFLALALGHADRVTKSKEIADLSDAILALEHEAWKKKFDQVDASPRPQGLRLVFSKMTSRSWIGKPSSFLTGSGTPRTCRKVCHPQCS